MEEVFQHWVRRAKQDGRTVLLSSHILAEVEALCDRVTIIRAGRAVETGTLAELRHLTRTSVRAELAGPATGLVLPAATLAIFSLAPIARITRGSMLAVLTSEFVRTARASGLRPKTVIVTYAFRNAMIPILTLAGLQLVLMINVAVVVEVIFSWPGVGRLLMEGLLSRDFPVVQGVVLMAGTMIVVVNLLIDVLYAYIDPRIRLAR